MISRLPSVFHSAEDPLHPSRNGNNIFSSTSNRHFVLHSLNYTACCSKCKKKSLLKTALPQLLPTVARALLSSSTNPVTQANSKFTGLGFMASYAIHTSARSELLGVEAGKEASIKTAITLFPELQTSHFVS